MSTTAVAGVTGAWWPMVTAVGHSSCTPCASEVRSGLSVPPSARQHRSQRGTSRAALLLVGAELVIREAELSAAHQLSPGLRPRLHCLKVGPGSQTLSISYPFSMLLLTSILIIAIVQNIQRKSAWRAFFHSTFSMASYTHVSQNS